MAELTDEPDGYLEHTPLGDFLAYSKTDKNPQTPLYSLEKARAILALSATGAEDAELRKKAARYDWLRSGVHRRQGAAIHGKRVISRDKLRALMELRFWCTPEELDAAVDAALQAAEKKS